ncbi:hypothetical protein LOTGIDRAFT_168149 [Lottia gigantea]|uniref:Uncharacterized protein n=1 Tax=Lottia gigantea TaxID=225164 RepID=V3ZVZ5_LOTGI|nr:hypothetical protein LOTGIDRAFT_168149 [Lottia gigantea]ESO85121.1 hypothetical protein LOTGIDRAFT_168149 [Lottia gigantea]
MDYISILSNILKVSNMDYISILSNVLNVNNIDYISILSNILKVSNMDYISILSNILKVSNMDYISILANILKGGKVWIHVSTWMETEGWFAGGWLVLGSRGEDSDGVEGEDESESEKRRGVPSLRERLPMSAGLGVGELRARLGVWFGNVVALDGAGVVSISVGRDMVTLVFVSLIVW